MIHRSKVAQGGPLSGLPLGLGVVLSVDRVLCCRLQMISVEVLGWMSWWWLDL